MKVNIIDGQMDLFSMPIQEPVRPKEEIIIAKPKIETDNFKDIINLYKDNCIRIVKTVSGALLVGLEDKTLYFNSEGKNEFNLNPDVGLTPADEIIIANVDKELNDIQLMKLEELQPKQYIKRKGEANVIILGDSKTITINPRGWVLEWKMKPKYHENELFITKMANENTDLANKVTEMDIIITETEEIKIDDMVEFSYRNQICIGKIVSIYNGGETVNVSWDGKHTAFYYKSVKKVS